MAKLLVSFNDLKNGIDLNQLYIENGGYTWEELFSYKGFIIYKDVKKDYYQLRSGKGIYYFNFKDLNEGIDIVDKMYSSNIIKY